MKHLLLYSLCLALFCSSPGAGQMKPLLFSYTSHPIIERDLIPLLTEAYRNLGYETSFVNMPSDRFIQQFESGSLDGDVARLNQLTGLLPSMRLVYKFDEISMTLRCRPGISCEEADLDNPKNIIFIPAQTQVFSFLQLNYKAKIYTVRDWSQITEMYYAGKLDRFFWLEGNLLQNHKTPKTNSFMIKTQPLDIYHVLHESQAELIPLISAELERLIAKKAADPQGEHEFKPDQP